MKTILKSLIVKFPVIIFLLILGLLFIVIFLGKQMRSSENEETTKKEIIKTVAIFDIQEKITSPITGEVDRADTVVLRATANGIVTRALKAGDKVYRGKEIIKLADTYSGSSQAEATATVAQRNAQYQNETINTQRDILKAEKKDLKKTKDRQARIAWKQHYLQEQSIELVHDTAQLQSTQAYASVALFRTVAPLKGQLEEVTVKIGDDVQAGQVLAILQADNQNDVRITAHIGAERAAHIDVESEVVAHYKNRNIPLEIVHIAQNGTGGQSYALTFRVDKETLGDVSDGSFIEIYLPLSSQENILIPLDSVHFSTESTEVYVVENNVAKIKNVTLGEVIGSYIIVTEGLYKDAKIIMDRNVTDGEQVKLDL